ncbi:MAG TPA: sugar ABC transporter ATP-binding protein [Aminobacteriaceae bacterium]|nr:sugar ABC transporter ATP-binding protein [Aminobacteriaceae bacterium]
MSILETRNLTKEFPGVRALSDFSFTLEKGEIHGLVGENGAGKSTLVKILAGVYTPTSGSFLLGGREMRFRSPRDAAERVGVVHQERELIPHFSGWENLFLGMEFSSLGFLRKRRMREEALRFVEKYSMNIDLDLPASELGSGRQEMLAILKVLFRDPEVVIFDEPTAPLSVKECESLFALIRDLKAKGLPILYISHHLSEVLHLADRITVLRNGRKVSTVHAKDADEQTLIRLMIERDMESQYPKRSVSAGEDVFTMERASSRQGRVRDVSIHVRRGEIVGFAGLVGAGRTELAKAVFCGSRFEEGRMTLAGKPFSSRGPGESIRKGIAMIPEKRREEGVVADMTVGENLVLPLLKQLASFGFLRSRQCDQHANSVVDKLAIKISGLSQETRTLSGGNQQKVSVGKWFGTPSELWIFDEPTQGIDVDAKREVYTIMGDLAERGAGVWFISSDLRELLAIADRIYVMKDFRIAGEFLPPFDDEEILGSMMGEGLRNVAG